MASPADVRSAPPPPPLWAGHGLIRWVCTNNPFYVLSAGLYVLGLYASFAPDGENEIDTWALMIGLSGYTLLLAATALVLVRFAKVWDDARTVLLLVVLMFLATSVTFDEVLVLDPGRGAVFYLAGLAFAVAVSETLLRGIRLKMPACYRLPYYLILALFFLYPLALAPLLDEPRSEGMFWGLFAFSSVAALVFLTLLPAIRLGANHIRDNGSPWPWPLYPWVLFGLLGMAVPARAFLLCWSMHLLPFGEYKQLMFAPYYVVPFGFAVAVLLLEAGVVSRNPRVLAAALLAPFGLVALPLLGHSDTLASRDFLDMFTTRLGGTPLYWTLIASGLYYAWAAVRGIPLASDGLTLVLAAAAFISPETRGFGELGSPSPAPLLAAAALQLVLGAWRQSGWRCLIGTAGVIAAVTVAVAEEMRGPVAFHLALYAVGVFGAAFNGLFGRLLRNLAAGLVVLACVALTSGRLEIPESAPAWVVAAYPFVLALLLAAYGLALRHRTSVGIAVLILGNGLVVAGWNAYHALRQEIAGLDYIVLSLALFVLAVLISLGKGGRLPRWMVTRGGDVLGSAAAAVLATAVGLDGPPGLE